MPICPVLGEALPNAAKINGFPAHQAGAAPLRAQSVLDNRVLQAVVIALQIW
jgi:hypothetical protein